MVVLTCHNLCQQAEDEEPNVMGVPQIAKMHRSEAGISTGLEIVYNFNPFDDFFLVLLVRSFIKLAT